MIGVTVHHDGADVGKLSKTVHAASVNLAGVHEGDALMGCGDHGRFGLGHLGKVGRKAATGDKSAGAHDGQIGMDYLERLHGERTVQITMTFAQCSAQHDDIDRGHALVDIIGDGDVGRDDGDAVALVEQADKFERGGARVDEQGVTVADEFDGALRDGLLGGDIDVDTAILVDTVSRFWSDTAPPCVRRNLPDSASASRSARAVTEDTPKVWAISATCTEALCSSISMMAERRSSAKARVVAWAISAPFSAKFVGIVLSLFSFIFFLSKKTPFDYLLFL